MRDLLDSLFFPPFLRRFDEKLLVERPSLWATRLHRVAWPAFLLALFSLGLGLLTPTQRPTELSKFMGTGSFLIILLQIGLLIFWLYRQDKYDEAREFGLRGQKSVWQEFSASIAALVIMNIALFLFITTTQHRARTIPKQTLARDMLILNTLEGLLSYEAYKQMECRYGETNDNANCLAYAADNLIESNFKMGSNHYYLGNKRQDFIEAHLSPDDIFALRDQWQEENYEMTMAIIAQYSGEPLEAVAAEWDIRLDHDAYVREARNTVLYTVYDVGYDLEWIGLFWLVIGTAAIHIALLRFTFKYAGRKWFFITGTAVATLFFIPRLSAFIMESVMGYSFPYRIFEWGIHLFGKSFNVYYPYGSWWHPTPFTTVCLLVALALVFRLRKSTQFTSKTALALYILPVLLVCGTYLLLRLFEVHSEEWIRGNFDGLYYRRKLLWNFRPPEVLRYATQFGYVPFLGWLKQKHTRLMSLPRT